MQQERPGAPLPFEACENFRELGGYTGCGGRHVKYGAFYRSPALANIKTPADRARFEALGVRTVFDFRSEKERTLAPDPDFPGVVNIPASAMLAEDGSEVDFDLEKLLRSEDGIRMLTEGVHESYARMPFGNPAYRALFGAIRAGQTPILFHCTAGKDRTGVAAMLLLKALGASDETALGQAAILPRDVAGSRKADILRAANAAAREAFCAQLCEKLPPQTARTVAQVATGVQRENLVRTMQAVRGRYGTFEAYFEAEHGLDARGLAALRNMYLE